MNVTTANQKKLKIGMVSPYGWDLPGGVQAHIQDLALYCMEQGHEVTVIAPAIDEDALPDWVTSSGRPVAIPYNGAVARVAFGPVANRRVRRWITDGEFDVLHLHEPAIPSLSLLACWAAEGPLVGTFHVSAPRQKAIYAVGPILEPAIEKLHARIAVSQTARNTLIDHLETDAVIIPNGINHHAFASGSIDTSVGERSIGFVGRFDEPRKGLSLLLESCELLIAKGIEFKVVIAGPGNPDAFLEIMSTELVARTEFLGRVSDERKQELLRSIALYVAPNTGGESFGIILAEAMAAGAPVLASNLPAFQDVLEGGRVGELFEIGDTCELALRIENLLNNPERRMALRALGQKSSLRFDWGQVGESILDVYRMVSSSGEKVRLGSDFRFSRAKLGREE